MRRVPCSLGLYWLVSAWACTTVPLRTSGVGMSLAEAREVVGGFEKTLVRSEDADPLRAPKSTDDLLAILKRDQVDLFPAGVEFARTQPDLKGRALGSQIEFAWGEAQLDLGRVFGLLANHQREQLQRLATRSAVAALTEEEERARAELHLEFARNEALAEALPVLAAEHVADGAAVAREVIAATPDDYLGYRLVADYDRLRGNWEDFDQTVATIAALNPRSNGLLFLRAMSELERFGRVEEGRTLLRAALANDPDFVRAQAALLRTATSLDERYAFLLELEAVNARHQLVAWAGPRIKASYRVLQRARAGKEPRGLQ